MSWFFSKSGYDADAQPLFDRIVAAGDTVDDTCKLAYNTFVLGCKADSIWDDILDLVPMISVGLTGALIKGKKLSAGWSCSNTGFVSGDYSRVDGLTGASGKHLGSGVLGTDLTTNSTGFGVYNRRNYGGQNQAHGARDSATAIFGLWSPASDGITYSDQYNSANELTGTFTVDSTPLGFVFATRPSSSEHTIYLNGTSVATTATVGGSLPTTEIFYMARNNGGAANHCTKPFTLFCLTLGMNSTKAAALAARVNTMQTTLRNP